jgi:DNA-binding transcriptional LysR family regulator
MQLIHVESFLEVARQGNLSRAADALFVTQPALTARLQQLEGELGAELFLRSRRGMVLTDAGRAFLPYAERALEALSGGRELLLSMQHGTAGELVVGAAPAISTYVLPPVLVQLAARHPQVRLVVRTGHSEEIVEMAVRREIQVGLVRELRHPEIESRPLYDDELVMVAEPGHPFAHLEHFPLARIGEVRLVLFDRTSSWYDLTNTVFRSAGVAPASVIELDNIDAAKKMVEAGLGVAFLPKTAVAEELAAGRLRPIALEGAEPIRRRIVAIRRLDAGPPSAVVRTFLEILAEIPELVPGAEAAAP